MRGPTDVGAPAINVRGLTMRYGRQDVLRGLDLTVEHGEVLALLGPNGAGKTTTVEILEGFRAPTGGEVQVLGCDPRHGDERWRAQIGVVLQSWRDHARWRVGELLEHVASYYPAPRSVAETLGTLGLAAQAGQTCQRLSGGQRRRLDVALGIIGDPRLLFLDEPTAGFDPVVRREFHELIARLKEGGMTMVLTTHDLDEAERLSDRTVVLIDGRVAASGTNAQLAEEARARARVFWTEDGERREQTAEDPSRLVWELHQKFDGPIPGLEVHRPTLEDVYLRMVAEAGA
ncbi:ABC transporter ATP-binding protein [Streptomyces sp. NPDC090023]|uniref:ABC transporter ATP-binding protein n=1 Tax=unclassified Streptomyces TaxID=2593676 RepID=UPI00381E5DBF